MDDYISAMTPKFAKATAAFERAGFNNAPTPVSFKSFIILGGKTDAIAQGYLYELSEKYGDKVPAILTECRRIIYITMGAYVGVPNDVAWAARAFVAVSEGLIKCTYFKPSTDRDNMVDFLDFMVLYFLVSASVATAKKQIQVAFEMLFESAEAHRLSDITQTADSAGKDFFSRLGLRGAKERHARDPKQTERNFVFECWKEWKQKPDLYKSKASFARDMLEKCEKLESPKVIEDWCREWDKEHKL